MAAIIFGGPAFPVPEQHYDEGMSLRDWFAGQALAGLCMNSPWVGDEEGPDKLATWAYQMADAMIAAASKE